VLRDLRRLECIGCTAWRQRCGCACGCGCGGSGGVWGGGGDMEGEEMAREMHGEEFV